jgi:hypothetical protein
MALTFSVVYTWDDGTRGHISGTVVPSGNTPPAETRLISRKSR